MSLLPALLLSLALDDVPAEVRAFVERGRVAVARADLNRDSRNDVNEPDKPEKTVHVPPRDFGLIDLADFDPENDLGHGKK